MPYSWLLRRHFLNPGSLHSDNSSLCRQISRHIHCPALLILKPAMIRSPLHVQPLVFLLPLPLAYWLTHSFMTEYFLYAAHYLSTESDPDRNQTVPMHFTLGA